jgi:hypothetical protein
MEQKNEDELFDDVNLPNTKQDVLKIYNELSAVAKNDNFFMAMFWSSYGFKDEADAYLNEYKAEFKSLREYSDRIKKSKE